MRRALGLILLILCAGYAGTRWPADPVAQVGVGAMLLAIAVAIWLYIRAQQRDERHEQS
jgi:hypothetical protein